MGGGKDKRSAPRSQLPRPSLGPRDVAKQGGFHHCGMVALGSLACRTGAGWVPRSAAVPHVTSSRISPGTLRLRQDPAHGLLLPRPWGKWAPQLPGVLWGSIHKLQVCSPLWHNEGLWVHPELPHFSQRGGPFAPLPLPPWGAPPAPSSHGLSIPFLPPAPSLRTPPQPSPSPAALQPQHAGCPRAPPSPPPVPCVPPCRHSRRVRAPAGPRSSWPSRLAPLPARPAPGPRRRRSAACLRHGPAPAPGIGPGVGAAPGRDGWKPPQREGAGVWGPAGRGPLAPGAEDG